MTQRTITVTLEIDLDELPYLDRLDLAKAANMDEDEFPGVREVKANELGGRIVSYLMYDQSDLWWESGMFAVMTAMRVKS